jgi:ubiquinone/menaquinone biosynthesis C-methylase UbiE
VTCVDLSRVALARAEEEFARRGIDAAFIVADVRRLPLADGSFDFVYAGGVVEHFPETKDALAQFRRVLRPGGRALVTVPALTASYPYLFLRGNVPCVPLLEDVLAFIHLRLLGGRYAEFGYERSFTRRRFVAEMRSAGFASVETGCFETYLPLGRLPSTLRPLGRRLARLGVFCPMYWALGVR